MLNLIDMWQQINYITQMTLKYFECLSARTLITSYLHRIGGCYLKNKTVYWVLAVIEMLLPLTIEYRHNKNEWDELNYIPKLSSIWLWGSKYSLNKIFIVGTFQSYTIIRAYKIIWDLGVWISCNYYKNCNAKLTKAKLLLLKLFHLFAREVLLVKQLEIEETKSI